jgi:plasmid stabilization system protein ParE
VRVVWTSVGWADVERIYAFLAERDLDAADEVLHLLIEAPQMLLDFPRRGSRLTEFDPREVREFRVGNYLMRYELAGAEIFVLRFFHGHEIRF